MLSFSSDARSREKNILHCLANEETAFHKERNIGPVFVLNQKLINKLSSIGHYQVSNYALKAVCDSKKMGPAVSFLRLLILEPNSIFKEAKNADRSMKALNESAIESLKSEASRLLFQFLSDIQTYAKDAKCLEKHIPEIKYYWERFRYLEIHIGTSSIVDDPDKIDNIFKKLKDIKNIINQCNKKNPRPKK